MTTDPRTDDETNVGEIRSGTVLLARLMWMVLGPILLLFTTHAIVTRGEGWLTAWDALYAVVAALMVGGRWMEQRSGAAMTAMGNRSTPEHFAKYVRILLPAVAGAWIVANAVGNHLLS